MEGKISVGFLFGKLLVASHLSSIILDLHSEVPHSVNPLFRDPKTVLSVYYPRAKIFYWLLHALSLQPNEYLPRLSTVELIKQGGLKLHHCRTCP